MKTKRHNHDYMVIELSHYSQSFKLTRFIKMNLKIAVLGAGVNGLACAVKIKEKYKSSHVVIISSDFSPNTTGDGSGGLWCPYLCGETPEHRITKWGLETYSYLHKRWLEGAIDICFQPVMILHRKKDSSRRKPIWADKVYGFQELDEKHLKFINSICSNIYVKGHSFSTFVTSPPSLLAHLTAKFHDLHGKVLQARVTSLQDPILEQYDVVVNCTGLEARQIVPDTSVFPIRGQIAKVTAPWIYMTMMDEDSGHYVIPNVSFCILGGTHQEHDYSIHLNEEDSIFIRNGCKQMVPSLENAEVQKEWVGLRPGRREVRLESEEKDNKLYIHNYGHGGSGLTLFWGCASEVLDLLEQHLYNKLAQCRL